MALKMCRPSNGDGVDNKLSPWPARNQPFAHSPWPGLVLMFVGPHFGGLGLALAETSADLLSGMSDRR